jgi:hypothetical protein
VQKQWAEALHYTGHERLTVDADQAYVERAIKPGFMRYEYEHATAGLGGDSLTARSAYQLMIAPVLALLFSILGAMLHTVKIINYSLVLVSIRGAIRATLVMMLCVGFTGFVWMTANPVTDAPLFKQLEKTQGAISPAAMRWIIQAEAVVYPISSSILSTVQPAVAKPVEAKPTRFIQL